MGQCSDGSSIVRFRCAAGIGAGKWLVSFWQYSVATFAELDITPVIELGRNMDINPHETTDCIECSQSETIIVGTVESIDDDGMAYIRLSVDCLIMVESVPGELSQGVPTPARTMTAFCLA